MDRLSRVRLGVEYPDKLFSSGASEGWLIEPKPRSLIKFIRGWDFSVGQRGGRPRKAVCGSVLGAFIIPSKAVYPRTFLQQFTYRCLGRNWRGATGRLRP